MPFRRLIIRARVRRRALPARAAASRDVPTAHRPRDARPGRARARGETRAALSSARAAKNSPLKKPARLPQHCVKKFFRGKTTPARHSVFTRESAVSAAPASRATPRVWEFFLSTKKCRDFAGEKIDGVWATTISSAPGSGQPHPVVVSNV